MLGLAQRLKDIFPTDLYNPEKIYDYVEAITLVGDAMTNSLDNIKSFTDSLKTNDQLAQDMANTLGVNLATSVDGLSALFNQLAYDTNGLTDADNDLLSANKDLLISTSTMQTEVDGLNITLESATSSISTLESVMATIKSTVDKLRGASLTTSQSLGLFYDAMARAQELSTGTDYEAYSKAVQEASSLSGALLNTNAFTSAADMQFAQLSAANQFELLGESTLTQIDYLKMIEENTRLQVDVLVQAMNELGANINKSLLSKIETTSPTGSTISQAYQDILGRSPETAGASYWSGEMASGALNTGNITTAIATASLPELYQSVLGRAPDAAGLAYWQSQLASGAISPTQIDEEFKKAAQTELRGFASGGWTGNISQNSIAGLVHGQENVISAPDSKMLGLNGGGNWGLFGDILSEIKQLKQLGITQASTSISSLATQRAILSETIAV